MTASRDLDLDLDRLVRAYLEDGPIELPRRSYEAVADLVDRTPQRAIRPWRDPRMSNVARLTFGLAAVIVAAVIGFNTFRGTGPSGTGTPTPSISSSPAPTPAPSASPSAAAYTWPRVLSAGTYSTSLSWDPSLVFVFTVGDGWQSRDINILKHDSMTVKFFRLSDVVTNACQRTLPKTPTGPDPSALVKALGKLVKIGSVSSAPVGDRGATYVEYTLDPLTACSPEQFALFKMPAQVCETGCGGLGAGPWLGYEFGGVREHNRLWIMDVGRRIVAINVAWTDAATPSDLDELQAVVDSIRLDTPFATEPPTPSGG